MANTMFYSHIWNLNFIERYTIMYTYDVKLEARLEEGKGVQRMNKVKAHNMFE